MLFKTMWSATITLFCLFVIPGQSQKCESYQGQVCKDYINYPVYIASESPIASQSFFESIITNLEIPRLINQGGIVDPPCRNATLDFVCSEYFPRCIEANNTTPAPFRPCKSMCDIFAEECGDLLTAIGKMDIIPSCNSSTMTKAPFAEIDCMQNTLPHILPQNFKCVSPLILRPETGETNPSTTCFGYCCVPCPLTHYFFKEGEMRRVDDMIITISVISLFAALFVVVSFLAMKNKRNFPSYLVIFTAVGLIIFYIPAFFSIGDPSRVRCVSPVTTAYFGYNTNGLCQAQSIMVVYGVLVASGWFFALVLNIHLVVVWRREMNDYFWLLTGVLFGLPIISLIAYNTANKSGYILGIWCTLEVGDWLNGALMGPLAFFIFTSFLFNLVTLYKIFSVARETKSQLKKIVKLQIRPFSFVFLIVLFFMFYWIHFEIVLAPLDLSLTDEPPTWVEEWVVCILEGKGQNTCSEISSPHLFNVGLFGFSEFGIHVLGIIIFAFFGARLEVINFWISKLSGKEFNFSSPGNTTSGNKSSSRLDLAAKELQTINT